MECRPEPSGVRAARLFVVDKLQEWQCDDLVESAALITSELATNAALHTRRTFSVGVHRIGSGVRVEVCDASPELPMIQEGHAEEMTPPDEVVDLTAGDVLTAPAVAPDRLFSGLGVVDAVASDWGTQPIPGRGKVVWFELLSSGSRGGLSALRRLGDPAAAEADLERPLPPLEPQGLDDAADRGRGPARGARHRGRLRRPVGWRGAGGRLVRSLTHPGPWRSLVSALDWGSRGRRFESSRPDSMEVCAEPVRWAGSVACGSGDLDDHGAR